MVIKCPKCGRSTPDDAVYCPYCAHGIAPHARTARLAAGGILLIVASVGAVILFALSVRALIDIYRWYPPIVAESWFIYDQLLALFSFIAFVLSLTAGTLTLSRKGFRPAVVLGVLSAVNGGGAWITSMIVPHFVTWYSFLYYFLPVFLTPLLGTCLVYSRKIEFRQINVKSSDS
jgi:hypothetical protein